MTLVWTGLAIAALALIAVAAAERRLRGFLKLREDVCTRLMDFAALHAIAQGDTRAALEEAQHIFHELGVRMSGFAGRRRVATLPIRALGYDPTAAANGLTGFSNAIPVYGMERLRWRREVERALKIDTEPPTRRSRLNPLLAAVAVGALGLAALTYMANRNLQHALHTAHIVRASIEKEAGRTHARAQEAQLSLTSARSQLTDARRRQLTAGRRLADTSVKLELTQKAKVAAEQSLEKLRAQLAATEDARKIAEAQTRALGEELAAAQAGKDEAERSLKAAREAVAQLTLAKTEAEAAAAKAKDELAAEKKAREAAEQAPHATPPAAQAP